MKFTVTEFNNRYPNSDACLEELKQLRFANFVCPKCGRKDSLTRIKSRPQYQCNCGHQVAPLAGTIFHKSPTPLKSWFWVMYVMTQTKGGVSAKQIERDLGVTYKCAYRMCMQVRKLMVDDSDKLSGVVEADETYYKPNSRFKEKLHHQGRVPSQTIMGVIEREGRLKLYHLDIASAQNLRNVIRGNVKVGSTVYTDGHYAYKTLPQYGYDHEFVEHSAKEWVRGDVHTQTIEGIWSQIKRNFAGAQRHVSPKYLQTYLNDYAWRYSHRNSEVPMFELLLCNVA